MAAIRRYALLLVVLLVGVVLGMLGWKIALLTIAPLVLIWFMLWDEKSYRRTQYKRYYQDGYVYKHQQ
ncbi:hypothetical protein [Vagococcus acidifermentans]|uniref:Uncharacterized protein n=1 Tax=Vagococcus acidifermentans TaxID=564710 RepID=A0A430ATS9_9ENTE|nr:hypothetical protein [Vagococcus acidifermentans]RSU11457.1 hypothetical protein CBF27_08135 [Vagococcus acidifermentans]